LADARRFPLEYVSGLDILVVRFPKAALR